MQHDLTPITPTTYHLTPNIYYPLPKWVFSSDPLLVSPGRTVAGGITVAGAERGQGL